LLLYILFYLFFFIYKIINIHISYIWIYIKIKLLKQILTRPKEPNFDHKLYNSDSSVLAGIFFTKITVLLRFFWPCSNASNETPSYIIIICKNKITKVII